MCELVKPVLTCFFDSDSRVRYYACESLYNIVKVARGSVLIFFNDIFDGLSKVCQLVLNSFSGLFKSQFQFACMRNLVR